MVEECGEELEPALTLVANVRPTRFYGSAGDVLGGTKHFVPGAKVTYVSAYWGMGAEEVTVIGRHRGSSKLVTVTMQSKHLTNWRTKVVHQPAVLRRLRDGYHEDGRTPQEWEQLAQSMSRRNWAWAFERSSDVAARLLEQWADDGLEPDLALPSTPEPRIAVVYVNDPETPVGVGTRDETGQIRTWVHPAYRHLPTRSSGADDEPTARLRHRLGEASSPIG